ncbi:MAG: haloacid dehalogenase-like hydrolase [Candidatus Micrarchaeota archaeon]|nr:haloacid dehalogenase-like hydrolase [Candidatus Micrarchaeota archaeon]
MQIEELRDGAKAAVRGNGSFAGLQPAGISDFDGALANGNLTISYAHYMNRIRLLSNRTLLRIMELVAEKNAGNISHEEFDIQGIRTFAQGMKGVDVEIAERTAAKVFGLFRPSIYASSYGVAPLFGENGYHTILMSVGIMEVTSLAALELGFGEVHATVLERRKGVYTGEVVSDLHMPGGKGRAIENRRPALDLRRSSAMGDSQADESILHIVGKPFALNPSAHLRATAETHGWTVLSHENVLEGITAALRREVPVARRVRQAV